MADYKDSDDVPPLEDMSEMLEHLQVNHTHPTTESTSKPPPIIEGDKNGKDPPTPAKKDSASFGGLKKGFLFSSSPKAKNVRTTAHETGSKRPQEQEEITVVKPDVSSQNPLRIPEVQQAMDASQTMLNNKDQWLTEDLLQRVTQSPSLTKHLGDPHFMQALTEFQTNPTAAMTKYSNNAEVQVFLKEFCALMGDHLSSLPITPSTPLQTSEGADISIRQSSDPKQPTAEDQEKINNILADPKIRVILQDPRIQRLFEVLRTDPNKAQSVLRSADPEMRVMIHTLCDAGLLHVQS